MRLGMSVSLSVVGTNNIVRVSVPDERSTDTHEGERDP